MIFSGLPNQSSAPLSTKLLHFAILWRSLLFCTWATDMVRCSCNRMSSSGRLARQREALFNKSQNSFTMCSNLEKLLDNISMEDRWACCKTSICASRYKWFHTLVCALRIKSPRHLKTLCSKVCTSLMICRKRSFSLSCTLALLLIDTQADIIEWNSQGARLGEKKVRGSKRNQKNLFGDLFWNRSDLSTQTSVNLLLFFSL